MRAPPADHWDDTLPPDDRERRRIAWEKFCSCRDCRHWSCDENEDVGVCGLVKYASFLTPEDFTCDDFKSATAVAAVAPSH